MDSGMVKTIRNAYKQGQEDEALEPIVLVDRSGSPVGRLQDGDSVIFYDIRGEREIEITQSLTDDGFEHFPVKKPMGLNFVTMIEYSSDLGVKVAFPPEGTIKNTISEVLSRSGYRFLKIAESEKAVHIGYFMNGKNEDPFPGEERVIVPSPEGVASYSQVPEMSASQVADQVIDNVRKTDHRVIMANLANVDVIGHIEDKTAVIKAVESVDHELGRLVDVCQETGTTLVVTADHGTVENWLYPDGEVNTGHTTSPVPFIIADFTSPEPESLCISPEGELSDVAPTLLDLLEITVPAEMTGKSLILDGACKEQKERRLLFLILDGWGVSNSQKGNLIHEAKTPHFDRVFEKYASAILKASGDAVGMPSHTVGNSEAGHLHIGAGRRILLDRVKIDKAVENGSFYSNEAFVWAMENAKNKGKALHLLGIVSHYSSHGTIRHLFALLELAKQKELEDVFIHALIGRRGEKPESGAIYVDKVEEKCQSLRIGRVVTVMGRYWALDREENWHLVEKAYRALVHGDGTHVP
jgi:2,3-bisphosphoglycerate-independent phosphoglycerate mutase